MSLCLAIPDGYQFLPPRCRLTRGHEGKHQSTAAVLGLIERGECYTDVEQWEDE